MSKLIGILTAGDDTPGLNAAIRGIGKAAPGEYGFEIIGFKDGFRGLVHNRFMRLESRVTTLGHLQRGGAPSSTDRLLASRFGTEAAGYVLQKHFGVMLASKVGRTQASRPKKGGML